MAETYNLGLPEATIKERLIGLGDLAFETHTISNVSYIAPPLNDGYWSNGVHTGNSYKYAHITNIKNGDVISLVAVASLTRTSMRFVDFYLGSVRVADAFLQSQTEVTVPSGVDNVYISLESGERQTKYGDTYFFRYSTTKTKIMSEPLACIKNESSNKITLSKNVIDVSAGTQISLDNKFDCKKNVLISAIFKFDSFSQVVIGQGTQGTSYSARLIVDSSSIYINQTDSVARQDERPHNLTIEEYLNVTILSNDSNGCDVVINTKGGSFKATNIHWGACNGYVFATPSSNCSSISLRANILDATKIIYLFGDSYTSLGDTQRYPYYLKTYYNDCIDNMLMSGFGGVSSAQEGISFRSILSIAKPRYIIWALGMNDHDSSSAANSNWVTMLNEVKSVCLENSIELILCTIPNVPSIINTKKNEIVRNSGYRYIDFAAAVGAEETGSTWYSGMLSSDNVHPSAEGAKALAAQFINDFPEIMCI